MKIKYNKEVDAMIIKFSNSEIDESDESKTGIIFDYDKNGNIVQIEILKASVRIESPKLVEFEVA